jgi:hypothetical protein
MAARHFDIRSQRHYDGDTLYGSRLISAELDDAFTYVLAELTDSRAGSRRVIGGRPALQASRRRERIGDTKCAREPTRSTIGVQTGVIHYRYLN